MSYPLERGGNTITAVPIPEPLSPFFTSEKSFYFASIFLKSIKSDASTFPSLFRSAFALFSD